ncbi:hypothetical protein LDENG_00236440, partial [Lucifuga dentata]
TISKIKHFLSPTDLENVIHALISSRLDYCNSLYHGISQATASRIQLIQKRCCPVVNKIQETRHHPYPCIPILAPC